MTTSTKATTKTAAPKLFEGKAVIEKELGLLKAAGRKLDDRIQVAGLSVINHIDKHGDITLVVGLMDSLPRGARTKAMIAWMVAHAKVKHNVDEAGKVSKDNPWLFDKTKETNMAGAIANPWYKFEPENQQDPVFDLAAALNSLLNKAAAAEKAGKTIEGAEQLTKLRLAMAAQ